MRLNLLLRLVLFLFAPRNITLVINEDWSIKISGINWMKLTASNCKMYRPDGRYFFVEFTTVLGHVAPFLFETADRNGVAGNIATTIKQSEEGDIEILSEKTATIDPKGSKVEETRATRSSISNADGSPIPSGTKGYSMIHLGPGETNNQRITGRVDTHGILKENDFEAPTGKFFVPLEDYLPTTDLPGQGVLLRYIFTQAAYTKDDLRHNILVKYIFGLCGENNILRYMIKRYGKENIRKLLINT